MARRNLTGGTKKASHDSVDGKFQPIASTDFQGTDRGMNNFKDHLFVAPLLVYSQYFP